jgi:hypothetical protein
LQSEVEVSKFDHIGQLHDDAIEGLKTFVEKIQGQPLRAFIELRVGYGLLAIDDRHTIGIFGEGISENVPQGPVPPVSVGAIPGRELGRESNDAL